MDLGLEHAHAGDVTKNADHVDVFDAGDRSPRFEVLEQLPQKAVDARQQGILTGDNRRMVAQSFCEGCSDAPIIVAPNTFFARSWAATQRAQDACETIEKRSGRRSAMMAHSLTV